MHHKKADVIVTELCVMVRHDPRFFTEEQVKERVWKALKAAHLQFMVAVVPRREEPTR